MRRSLPRDLSRQVFAHWSPAAPSALACAAAACAALTAQAQEAQRDDTSAGLPTVTITAPAERQGRASISGLGNTPGWQAPVQAQTYGQTILRDAGITRLADLTKLDEASISEATLKLEVNGEKTLTVGEGDGPVEHGLRLAAQAIEWHKTANDD